MLAEREGDGRRRKEAEGAMTAWMPGRGCGDALVLAQSCRCHCLWSYRHHQQLPAERPPQPQHRSHEQHEQHTGWHKRPLLSTHGPSWVALTAREAHPRRRVAAALRGGEGKRGAGMGGLRRYLSPSVCCGNSPHPGSISTFFGGTPRSLTEPLNPSGGSYRVARWVRRVATAHSHT